MKTVTLKDRPDLQPEVGKLAARAWPEFMMHDPATEKYWNFIYDRHPEFQLFLLDDTESDILAIGNSIPLSWDAPLTDLPDTGLDWILETYAGCLPFTPKNQFALQIMVNPAHLGRHLSGTAVAAMANIGRAHSCRNLLAPVRPNRKAHYPLIPMERYTDWRRDDGLPFDPWMRVHARLGAEVIRVCNKSMYIPGTIAEWEEWTGLPLPDSGQFVIPGALAPISVDRERDLAEYIEPNVWMRHPL